METYEDVIRCINSLNNTNIEKGWINVYASEKDHIKRNVKKNKKDNLLNDNFKNEEKSSFLH